MELLSAGERAAVFHHFKKTQCVPSLLHVRLFSVPYANSHLNLPIMAQYLMLIHISPSPSWHNTYVIPIFKKGEPSTLASYHPIYLTGSTCKVMERVLKDDLWYQITLILCLCFYHYISRHSTMTHLLKPHSIGLFF